MQSSVGFVVSGGLSSSFATASSTCTANKQIASRRLHIATSRSKVSRAHAIWVVMNSAEQGGDDDQLPPEPYPGYYRDLRKMGLDPKAELERKEMEKKARKVGGKKSLYRADGTAYAPWMVGKVNEDVSSFKSPASKTDAKGKLAIDPQQQELAGTGLRWRMLGDEIELFWSTGNEAGNQGFIVQKRRGKDDKWEKVSDFRTESSLRSKGADGGSYSYLMERPEPGNWVYRVSDEDVNGKVSDLSQTLVEIESEQESKKQQIALIAFVVLVVILGVSGYLYDPQAGY